MDALPASAHDLIFQHLQLLSPTAVAQCSLACRAWRQLPHLQLQRLVVTQHMRLPAGQICHCSNIHTIVVENGSSPVWQQLAAQLLHHPLPRLKLLVVAYSSTTTRGDYQLLARIQQVQGCSLQLAATNRQALAELAALQLPSLAQLDVNLPYLFEGAQPLICQAAVTQGSSCRVSVWICCWGGCPGLAMADALQFHTQLPGSQLVGLEAINMQSHADWHALTALTGLTALGVNLRPIADAAGGQATTAVAAAGGGGGALPAAGVAAWQAGAAFGAAAVLAEGGAAEAAPAAGPLSLLPLAALAPGLGQLTLHGSSPTGWAHATALTALTGLRKLSLLSDNCSLPLPLLPFLPHLAGHLTHLAIERAHLEHPSDLSCLSMLTRLELLSLKLNIDPPDGCWLPDGGGSACSSPRGSGSEGQLGGSCPASPTVLMGQLSLGEAGDKDAQQQGQAQPSERFDCEESELSGGGGRGNGVVAPPDPGLVDLSWLRQLTRLRMAWLEVPQLELSHLPASLEELDCQKLSAGAATWVTCRGCEHLGASSGIRAIGDGGSSGSGGGCGHVEACSGGNGSSGGSGGVDSWSGGGSASSSSKAAGRSDSAVVREPPLLQLPRLRQLLLPFHGHAARTPYLDALLLCLTQGGCPELRDVDLLGWQVSEAAAAEAVACLPCLRVLGMATPVGQPDTPAAWGAVQRRLRALVPPPRELKLVWHKAVSLYPFSLVDVMA